MALKTGKLTEEERERIAELAEQGMSYIKAARKLGRHQSAVQYHYCVLGYVPIRKPVPTDKCGYMRKGKVVRYFTAEEDRRLLTLSLEGKNNSAIGRILGRRSNSIRARLQQLAATEEDDRVAA